MTPNLDELEQSLGYTFRDRALLDRALTHSSSANELVGLAEPGALPEVRTDNERLEFLGDSILGWLVSEWLFARFPDFNEGQLSLLKNHLVSAAHLLAAAHRLDLGRHLHLGRGEETAGGRSKQRLLVNAFEAVLAAVYLDGGVDAARAVIVNQAIPNEEDLAGLAGAGPPRDFRAELDRLARDRALPRPEYQLVGENGPGHARTFMVEVRLGRDLTATAAGSSKKSASHNAARQVCEQLRVGQSISLPAG
jgi:ribonuclease III